MASILKRVNTQFPLSGFNQPYSFPYLARNTSWYIQIHTHDCVAQKNSRQLRVKITCIFQPLLTICRLRLSYKKYLIHISRSPFSTSVVFGIRISRTPFLKETSAWLAWTSDGSAKDRLNAPDVRSSFR